jgi:hypothetical protein
MSSIYVGNYSIKTVNNQGFKEEYRKRPLNKIKRGFFNEVVTMAKNGDTAEQIWKYVNDEISRIYRIRKIKKALKSTSAILTASFKRISLNFNRISSREYHSPTRRRASASTSNNTDSGDPDQPEPPSPPGLAHLLAYPQITHTQKKNRYSSSWQSAPNGCSLVGGGKI